MKVRLGTRTSSSGWTPADTSARCRAAVPLTTATAWRAPTASATIFSKRSTNGPTDETQLVSRHSLTYAQALPAISGTQSGTKPRGAAPGSNDVDTGTVPPLI